MHWSNGSDSIKITVKSTGHFSAKYIDSSGCESLATETDVIVNPIPSAYLNAPYSICEFDTVTLKIIPAAGQVLSYLWDDGSMLDSNVYIGNQLQYNSYFVKATNEYGCTIQLTNYISINPAPYFMISGNLEPCVGQTVTLQSNNTATNITYKWEPYYGGGVSNQSSSYSFLPSQTTIVKVTAYLNGFKLGCSSVKYVTINMQYINTKIVSDSLRCLNFYQDTKLDLSQNFPNVSSSILWSNGNSGESIYVRPNVTTTYSAIITTGNGCSATAYKTLIVDSGPKVTITGDTTLLCFGQPYSLTANGAHSYNWSGGDTTNVSTFLAGDNNYSLYASDIFGCISTRNINLTYDYSAIPFIVGNLALCPGDSTILTAVRYSWADGLVTSYLWNNGNTDSTITVTPLATTNYSVTIQSNTGCVGTSNIGVTVLHQDSISLLPDTTILFLGDSSYLTLNPYPQSCLWNTGDTISQIKIKPTNDTLYSVIAIYPSGCSIIDTAIVFVEEVPFIIGPDSLCSGQFGLYSIVNGDKYKWYNGDTTSTLNFSSISNGIISISALVTTPRGKVITIKKYIKINYLPSINITGKLKICQEDSTLLVASNSYSLSLLWSNGSTNDSIWVKLNSTTLITVVGITTSGCISSDTSIVEILPKPIISISGNSTLCFGESDLLTASGGGNYFWNTNAITNRIIVSPDKSQYYFVYTIDSLGCRSNNDSINVTVVPLPEITITGDQVICSGDTTILTVSSIGSLYWNTGDTTSTISVAPKMTTIYKVFKTDPTSGCIGTDTAVVNFNSSLNASGIGLFLTVPTCQGTTRYIGVYSNSNAKYYLWSTGATTSSIMVPNLPVTYSLTISNHNQCPDKTFSYTLDTSSVINCKEVTITGDKYLCLGGSTKLTATGCSYIGTPQYYIWNNGVFGSIITVAPIVTTTYTVQIVYSNCIKTGSFTVNIMTDTLAIISGIDTACVNSSFNLQTISNGLSYHWSGVSGSNNNYSNLFVNSTVPGNVTYGVTVTYSGGCTITGNHVVNFIPEIDFTVSGSSVLCKGDSINLIASDSSLNYTWYGLGDTEQNQNVYYTPSNSGNISVRGNYNTNTKFCTKTKLFPIIIRNNSPIKIIGNQYDCSGTLNSLSATGGTNYLWNTGETTDSIQFNLSSNQIYYVNGINYCNQFSSDTISINIINGNQIFNFDTTICSNSSPIYFKSHFKGNYLWNNGDTTSSSAIIVNSDTTFFVTIQLLGGCSITEIFTIHVLPNPILIFAGNTEICQGDVTTISVTGANRYLWFDSTAANSILLSTYVTNWYHINAWGNNGCKVSDSIKINVNLSPQIIIYSNNITSVCPNNKINLQIQDYNFSSNTNYSYIWSNGSTSYSIQPNVIVDTTFSVTVTNSFGCSNQASIKIYSPPIAPILYATNDTICAGTSVTIGTINNVKSDSIAIWSIGIESQYGISVTPTQTTTYSLTSYWKGGCFTTSSKTIYVKSSTNNIIISGNLNVCASGSTILRSSIPNVNWSGYGVGDSIIISPSYNSTYQAYIVDANGCFKSTTVSVNVIPNTLSYSTDSIICGGNSINLSVYGGTSYLWNTGQTTSSINLFPTQSTIYNVHVTNGTVCEADHYFKVGIPTSVINTPISGDIYACYNEVTQLTATLGSSYLWSTGDTTRSITIPINTPTIPISVIVSLTNGCTSTSAVYHQLIAPPIISITGDTTICKGTSSVYFYASPPNATYLWSTGAVTNYLSINTQVDSTYYLTLTNSYGCSSDTSLNVYFLNTPIPVISASGPTQICPGDSITLSCSLSNLMTYNWSNFTHNINTEVYNSGTYYLNCIDSNSCIGYSNSITITNLPTPILLTSIIADTICAGMPISIIANGANSYSWLPTLGVSNPLINNPILNPTTSTIYTVTGTNSSGCKSSKDISIYVNPRPTINAGLDTTILLGQSILLGGQPTASGIGQLIYLWSPSNSLNQNTISNPLATPLATTIYFLTVYDSNVCWSTDTIKVIVNLAQGNSAFNQIQEFSLFPNPTNNSTTLKSDFVENGVYYLKLTNTLGEIIISKTITVNSNAINFSFDLSNISNSIYYLEISNFRKLQKIKLVKTN